MLSVHIPIVPLVILLTSAMYAGAIPQKRQNGTFQSLSSTAVVTSTVTPLTTVISSATTGTATTTPSTTSSSSHKGMDVKWVAVPIVFVAIASVIAYFYIRRKQFPAVWRMLTGQYTSSGSIRPHGPSRNLTAEELSGRPSQGSRGQGERRRSRRSRLERNLRRTESGHSVRTLPAYSKEAGDEELVLVRQRSQASFSDESYSEAEGEGEEGRPADPERGLLTRPSSDRHGERDPAGAQDALEVRVSDPLETLRSPSPSYVPQSAPATISSFSESATTPRRTESIVRRGWGEAPTYLEAMSTPSLLSTGMNTPDSATVPPPRDIRTRTSSTFRGLLSRAGLGGTHGRSQEMTQISRHSPLPDAHGAVSSPNRSRSSSTAHLLHPTMSHLSSVSTLDRGSSPHASPWASQASLTLISSPLPNSAVRASFDSLPRAGLSDDQARFLGSKEVFNLAGVRVGEVPSGRRRRARSDAASSTLDQEGQSSRRYSDGSQLALEIDGDAPEVPGAADDRPPTWEQSEGARRNTEAFERRNLAKPVIAGTDQAAAMSTDPQANPDNATVASSSRPEMTNEARPVVPQLDLSASPPFVVTETSTTQAPSLAIEPPTPTIPASPSFAERRTG
ncbi:hypothetical protein IAU60_003416 [Kwoniella sp. DSM 27419]